MPPRHAAPDVAADLARFVVRTGFDDLPGGVVRTARRFVLDALGNAFAGSSASGARQARDVEVLLGGRPECSVAGFGDRLSAPQAAFLNGMMIHSRDFDDTHDVAIVHASASVLPAALALAERLGGLNGGQFITAFVLGVDLVCRLGLSLRHYDGWHNSSVCGGFGAAAAAAKVLGLDERGVANALGIAFAQAAGNIQCIRDGALTKRMQLGFAARSGVLSAIYAEAGLTGTTHTFQGPYGFFALYDVANADGRADRVRRRAQGTYGPHELIDGLGSRFEISNLSMKPYPNCRAIHPAIAGILALRRKHAIEPDQVARIVIRASARTHERTGSPLDATAPSVQVSAQFNMAYAVAVAIYRGAVGARDFESEAMNDAVVGSMMRRVALEIEPSFEENLPVHVEIVLHDGRRLDRLVETLPGSPDDPLDDEEAAMKFRQCCGLSAEPISPARADAVVEAVAHLESMRDMRELTDLLHRPTSRTTKRHA